MIKTKALYNLLRLNAKENSTQQVDLWVLEDLRLLPLEVIFNRLASLGMQLDRNAFIQYATETGSPEELAELLIDEEKDSGLCDQTYLLLFELWRRLLPERPSLSIFCDELDRRIEEYNAGTQKSDELVQDGLANLLEILKEHVDQGMTSKEAFATLSDYCANDLECFLFENINELLDMGNQFYARDLLEEFEPFIQDSSQFEFLAARLFSFTDIQETNQRIAKLLKKALDPELLFEILHLLVASGEHHLFQDAMKKLLPQLKTEEEFQEVMELAADYYRRLDQDEREEAIIKLKTNRHNVSSELSPKDADLCKFEQLCNFLDNPLGKLPL
jgi:hypothetical protein